MNRIDQLFTRKQRDILNVYFTAGFPGLNDTGPVIEGLSEAGVDLIEVGMPYSDPLADGPTIQQSGQAALKNGMTMPLLFDQLQEVRKHTAVPLVLMGYLNQVMQYGEQRFIRDCVEAGVDGLILPDLPLYEYEQSFKALIMEAGLGISFLITPQTNEERILKVDELSRGFIYMVANSAITGGSGAITEKQLAYFRRVSALRLKNPRLIGFGISDHASFSTACRHANGAIIGSAFIRALAKGGEVENTCQEFVQLIRGAVTERS